MTMTAQSLRKVDHSGLKTGQALTIGLLLIGFIFESWLFVAFVALAQFLGGFGLLFAPYRLIYQYVVKPTGFIKPHVIDDNPEPHRFSMFVGTVFNGAATIAIYSGFSTIGWTLVWTVIALASLNFFLNFCLGCWFYYQFNRYGLPGFNQAPIQEG
jgi:hypothetical protein